MFDKVNVTGLLKAFYDATGIKVVVLSSHFEEIMAYPERSCEYCEHIQKTYPGKCDKSTVEFCSRSRSIKNLYSGKCHAGLAESVLPLFDNGLVVGYVMFGQILLSEDENSLLASGYENTIASKTREQTDACAYLLRALAHYITDKMVSISGAESFGLRIAEYIKSNPGNDLSVKAMCKRFDVSKSKLYILTQPYMPDGIAAYVKKVRMDKAKELTLSTDMSVSRISMEIGFEDSSYFSREFKKIYGMSVRDMRREMRINKIGQ